MALERSYSSRLGHTESFSSLGTDSNDARATQERRRRLSAMKTQLYSRDNDDDRSVDSQMDGSDKSSGSTTMDASLKSFTSWLGSKGGADKRSSKSSNTSTTSSNSSSSNLSSQDSLGSGGSGSHGQKQRQSSVLGKMLSWGGSARFVDNKSNEGMGDDVSDDSSVSLDDDDIFSFPTTNGSSLNGSGAQLSFHNSGKGSLLDNAHPTRINNRSSSRLSLDTKESDHEERKLSPQVEARRKRMVEKVLHGLNNKEEEAEEKEKEPSPKERQPRTRRTAKPRPSIRQEAEPEEPKDEGPLLYGDKVATYKVDSAKEVQRLKAAKLAKKASRDDLSRRDDGAPASTSINNKRAPRRQRSSIRAFRSTDGHNSTHHNKTTGGAPAPLRRNRTVDPNASARRLSSASIALNWNAAAGPAAAANTEEPPKESSNSSNSSGHSAPKEPGLQRRHTNASIRPRRQRTVNLEDSPTSTKDDASVASVRRAYGQSRPRRSTSTIEGESRLRRAGSQRPEGRPRRSTSSKKLPPRLATH